MIDQENQGQTVGQNEDSSEWVYYVYAVLPGNAIIKYPYWGIDDTHPIKSISCKNLQALVSKVPVKSFNREVLQHKLKDRVWLEEAVRRHTAIVHAVQSARGVIPMRFMTLCKNIVEVKTFLKTHERELADVLQSVSGAQEWGIKVYCDNKKLHRLLMEQESSLNHFEPDQHLHKGTSFLLRKKKKKKIKEYLTQVCVECRDECHSRLASLAVQAEKIALQGSDFTGRGEPMIFNSAYLVNDEESANFKEMVKWLSQRFNDQGFEIVQSGPWPPYHFVKKIA